MNYRVTAARVEINGTIRQQGDVISEAAFRPVPEDKRDIPNDDPLHELSELDSLLKTGHVVPA